MQNLKSSSLLLSMCFFISACQSTKAYNLKTFHTGVDDLHVIHVNSDRVRQKCLFFDAEGENKWRHQYLMYVLNDKNEVLEIMQSTNQDKDSCYSQLSKIQKILQTEPQVNVCARTELKKNLQGPNSQGKLVNFGLLGDYGVVYEALTFDSICNSKKCLSHNDMWVNTCPGFEKQ